jgi:hypothetical protein
MLRLRNGLIGVIGMVLWAATAAAQTLPRGIYALGPGSNLASIITLTYVDGASLRFNWTAIEPGDGTYNWSSLDKNLTTVANAHKHAQILLMVGQQTPCWLRNDGASVYADYATFDSNCRAYPSEKFQAADASGKSVVPLPWNATYESKLGAFITALANHVAATGRTSVISGVVSSGIAYGTAETLLPHPTDVAGWTAAGYSRTNVKNAYRTIFTDWAHAFPNAGVSTRFMYDSFPQGFGACHSPDNLFPRELIDIAYSVSPTQAIMGYNGLDNRSSIDAGSGPGNLLPQMCAIQRGPGNLWQDCEQAKENCENGTDANTFQGSSLTPKVAYEGLQEDGPETSSFATEWGYAERAFTKLLFIEVHPQGFTTANQSALVAAHAALTQ